MDKKISLLILAFGVLATSTASAQPISWAESIQRTSVGNPDLEAAQSTVRAEQEAEKAAASGYFPTLSASVNYNYGNTSTTTIVSGASGFDTTTTTGTGSSYSTNLTATQNLFEGFQDQAKVDQAKGNRQVAEGALIGTKAQVSYNLKSAFAGLVYTQNLVSLTEDIIKRREANLKLVQLSFEGGSENRGSVLLSKANLEQSKLEHLQAVNALSTARTTFARILGLDDRDDVEVQGMVPINEPPVQVNFNELAAENPDYLQAAAREKVAQAGLTLAQAGFYPSLNLTGSSTDSGPDWYPDRNRWYIGASLSFPLFNGGRDYYGSQSAKQSLRAASFTRVSDRDQALVKLKTNYSTYIESAQRLIVDQSFVEAAIVREKVSRQKYNNGLQTFEDWDLIENDLITRQKTLLATQRDRTTAEAAWEQAQGKGSLL
jgi:outer membrane protein